MALSQLLEDSPMRLTHKDTDLYNERHRLALEELLTGGVDNFLDFLRRERIPNFLSDSEIQQIKSAAVSLHGEDQAVDQSLSSSVDCSSVTYFPEVSDIEPPLLENGWPAFTASSYRGVTRAVAYFQPSYGESIYSCKEAVRRLIKSAKEVIAIVTDSLTDLDIFRDLQEASSQRRVPVYILLDQSCAHAFLQMCRNVGVRLDDLQLMRARIITGTTYYTRSGARVTGKVHERFMLIDGNKAATGSYRFNWTDGKLNTSNLIELSGQITEKFDEEFRILYAQSLPLNTRGSLNDRNNSVFEHLKQPAASSPRLARERSSQPVCLTSTPTHKPRTLAIHHTFEPSTPDGCKTNPVAEEGWMEQQHMQEEILAGSTSQPNPPNQPSEKELLIPTVVSCHASSQTSCVVMDSEAQTDLKPTPTIITPKKATPPRHLPPRQTSPSKPVSNSTLKECFHKLTEERRSHYANIRSKLEHMVTVVSQRRELADVTNVIQGPGTPNRLTDHKDREQERNPRVMVESPGKCKWPRARCVD